jgi:hypothetical protein
MKYLKKLEAISSYLVSFKPVKYARDEHVKVEPEEKIKFGFGIISDGKNKTLGYFIAPTKSKNPVTCNPAHIVNVEINGMGSKETPLYLSYEEYKNDSPVKFKNIEDPFRYVWIELTLSNGKTYKADYLENEKLLEKLHLKLDDDQPDEDEK